MERRSAPVLQQILKAIVGIEFATQGLGSSGGSLQAHGHDLCGQLDIIAHAVEIISRL